MVSRTQIIATIGPASKSPEVLVEMIKHQLDVARLNFSWGTFEEYLEIINNIRAASQEAGRKVLIIADLPGPRLQAEEGHYFDKSADGPLTRRDLEIINFGVQHGVDYITLSYIGLAEDIKTLRAEIKKAGAATPIIAKIERKLAVQNADEIIEVADAIMIGRGDLGNEVPIEEIPFVQDEIIKKAKAAGKPVIVATQMLFSMVENSKPTRAEVADVSQAILEGADAVMLSEETAIGKYPVEVIKVMERIVLEAEEHKGNLSINPL